MPASRDKRLHRQLNQQERFSMMKKAKAYPTMPKPKPKPQIPMPKDMSKDKKKGKKA